MDNCSCQNNNNNNNNNNNKEKLLHEIMSLNFAINDLTLYLDTHPNDTKAICLHNEYVQKVSILKEDYEKLYGPLTINFISNTWDWIDEPWPWERGAY